MKKISISLLLVIAMICSTLSIGGQSGSFAKTASAETVASTTTGSTLTEQEFIPSADYVKQIGRTYLLDDTLWCALSGTGIEFTFTGTKAELNIVGDSIAANSADGHYCRYAIYVNDKRVKDQLIKQTQQTITAFESNTEQTVTVRVVKLSESADSTMGIGKIKVTANGVIKPTAAKTHHIEFIGDSITCGYGVDDDDRSHHFSTATEDFTKTYAYKTAQALNADYSDVSFSGYGIVSGYTSNGKQNKIGLVPPYYEKMGFSYGNINNSLQISTVNWDFSKFVPDVIVINLGTNDNSYCRGDLKKQKKFVAGYVAFLKQVRQANPNATIVCTLGIMGQELYPSIQSAVKQYKKATLDKNVSTLKFDVQQQNDGICADWHPSDKTHTKAASKLTDHIKKIMKW
jgi:lysophospholipase L1-like esterase